MSSNKTQHSSVTPTIHEPSNDVVWMGFPDANLVTYRVGSQNVKLIRAPMFSMFHIESRVVKGEKPKEER